MMALCCPWRFLLEPLWCLSVAAPKLIEYTLPRVPVPAYGLWHRGERGKESDINKNMATCARQQWYAIAGDTLDIWEHQTSGYTRKMCPSAGYAIPGDTLDIWEHHTSVYTRKMCPSAGVHHCWGYAGHMRAPYVGLHTKDHQQGYAIARDTLDIWEHHTSG